MDRKETFWLNSNYSNATHNNINKTNEWNAPEFNASLKNISLAVVLGILDIITIFGNLLVILSFVFEKRLLQPFNLYILNLSVTDFLVAVTAMTFYTIDTLLGYWPFGVYLCGIWIYFDFAMTFASVFTLVAISGDRFWCVTWPIHFKMHNNKRKTSITIAVIWFCVLAVWTPPFIGDRLRHNESHMCIWEPSDNKEFVVFVAVIGHYVPCFIMIFCYVKVLLVMRRRNPKTGRTSTESTGHGTENCTTSHSATPSEDKTMSTELSTSTAPGPLRVDKDLNSIKNVIYTVDDTCNTNNIQESIQKHKLQNDLKRSSNQQQREKRIFITLTYILSSYIVCWFPFYIAFDLSAWQPELVPGGLYSFFFWCTYVNSVLNPFIYAFTNKEFRAAFIKVQKMLCMCSKLRKCDVSL